MSNPIREHQEFIDALIKVSPSIASRLIDEEGMYSKARSSQHFNQLVSGLTASDKKVLVEMLNAERRSAIFDMLVRLHEFCATRGWTIIKDGVEVPTEPYGYTMFEEYITLLEDKRGWSALE